MRWEVTLTDQSKVIIEADLCHVQNDGTLTFIGYLPDSPDARTTRTAIEGYASGTWTHMKVVSLEPTGNLPPSRPVGKAKIRSRREAKIDLSRLKGKLVGVNGSTKGQIAKKIGEILGVKKSTSYQIVRQLIAEGKVRRPRGGKGWSVVDPELDPTIPEMLEEGETLEQWVKEEYVAP